MENNFLNPISSIFKKPTINNIFNDERVNVFPLRLETRQACTFLPFLVNTEQEVLAPQKARNKKLKT